MKMKALIQCDICGEMFTPRNSRQHFCRKPVIKKCLICGDEFETTCSSDAKKVCSKLECRKQGNQVSDPVERICKQCGDRFLTICFKQMYCNVEKKKACPVCGKVFNYICNQHVRTTCGDIHCQAASIKNKRRNNIASERRMCKWCGKEFTPKEVRDVYCYEKHYKKCVICGQAFEIDVRSHQETNTCSKECMGKLMSENHDYGKGLETQKKVLLEKYGVENAAQVPGAQERAKQTMLAKYGVEWYTQTEEYKERVKKTSLETYGVEHHLQSKAVIEKRIQSNLEKYGHENVFQTEGVKEKSKQTNLVKYGYEYASQSPELIAEVKQRNLAKYGVEHPMMLQEYKNKAIATNVLRYGRKAYTQQHIDNIQSWYQFIDNPRDFIETHFDERPRIDQLADYFGVERTAIDMHLEREDAFDCIKRAKSMMEEVVTDFIKKSDSSIRVVVRSKSEIYPYELDLYLPDFNFAIECDPTCTHNSSACDPWGSEPKNRSYHKMKTDMCEEKGIELLHIFGYDWEHKRDIILSMIKNKLGKSERTIYARKCKVVEVSGMDAIKFLEANHRQGAANSPVRLGLEYDGELVSLMTFGKMRGTIGTGSEDLSDCWELVRFCSLLNTTVVGGASRLLKHFINKFNPKRIRSFSDRAHTSGKLYSTLGFKEVRRSDSGYVWVNVVDDRAYHRVNAQKQNLKKFLKDESIDLTKTEREIMIEHGFVQVFDSGTITWEWRAC